MLWGRNCNIQPYSCLMMARLMLSFNSSDVEGSLPGSFPLLNKNTCFWSIFVIRLMGQVFCRHISQRYPLINLLAAHILNLSATD